MSDIEQLKEDHKGEWLAIAYSDYGTEGPSEGDLIVHSRDEDTVWEAIKDDPRKIYVTYAGPLIDDDMAIAL